MATFENKNKISSMDAGKEINEKHLICLPGQRLCLSDENTVAGQGTYERQGYIYATLAGSVKIRNKDKVDEMIRNSFKI